MKQENFVQFSTKRKAENYMNQCDICGRQVPEWEGGQQLQATALENNTPGKGVTMILRACAMDENDKAQFLENSNICLACAYKALLQVVAEIEEVMSK